MGGRVAMGAASPRAERIKGTERVKGVEGAVGVEKTAESAGAPMRLRALRSGRELELTVTPAENTEGRYQLGLWLRDSVHGIGTITFYDPVTGAYGALGHGVALQSGGELLDISGGLCSFTIPGRTEPGWFSDLSIPAKNSVEIPVLLTGGVTTGEEAEKLLHEEAADLIGVGRALLADPDWAVKALQKVCMEK